MLVLTIDLAVVGARHRDTRNAVVGNYPPWINARRALDLLSHPRWIREVAVKGRPLTFGNLEKAVPDARTPDAFRKWVDGQFDPSVTWADVAWVREHWDGRLIVKGVLDSEDARRRSTPALTEWLSPTTAGASLTASRRPSGRAARRG